MSFWLRLKNIGQVLAYFYKRDHMNLESVQNISDKVLECDVQDESGLNDFQKLPDRTAIAIDGGKSLGVPPAAD